MLIYTKPYYVQEHVKQCIMRKCSLFCNCRTGHKFAQFKAYVKSVAIQYICTMKTKHICVPVRLCVCLVGVRCYKSSLTAFRMERHGRYCKQVAYGKFCYTPLVYYNSWCGSLKITWAKARILEQFLEFLPIAKNSMSPWL